MSHVLVQYDIAENLKIANPSGVFRRYGARTNLSSWAFPEGNVPTDEIERLKAAGANVHIIRFHPEDATIVLDLVKKEMRKHLKKVLDDAAKRSFDLRATLNYWGGAALSLSAEDRAVQEEKYYRKWRAVIARARRELGAAEQCAMGFTITGDVADGLDAIKNLVHAELGAALAWKDAKEERERKAAIAGVGAPAAVSAVPEEAVPCSAS